MCSLCDINEYKTFRILCSLVYSCEDPTGMGPTSGIRAFGLDIIRRTVQYSRFGSISFLFSVFVSIFMLLFEFLQVSSCSVEEVSRTALVFIKIGYLIFWCDLF